MTKKLSNSLLLCKNVRSQNLNVWVVVSMALVSISLTASADVVPADQSNSVSGKTSTATSSDNAAPAAAVDDLITNNNLRALSGSTSLWSIASQFNYNGGTVLSPLSQDRPNISDASGTTIKSDLDGAISVKYNLDVKNSLMAGIGIRWIAPLTPTGPTNYNGTLFDVMNPYVVYQYIYKWSGIQSVLQVQGMQWTQADQTALGFAQQLNVDQENMYEIGSTGLSVGVSAFVQFQTFNKTGTLGTPGTANYVSNVQDYQSQYSFGLSPELEYQLSEKINLRTLVSPCTFEHYVSQAGVFGFTQDTVYQSVGVGISVTRDVFLYPNVQFLPLQFDLAQTNVGLGATVNLF